jgi:D-beta-D-heptose 7-phosphate kinase/D-beta-D-heptose 1-phosphate adenosyltransferase
MPRQCRSLGGAARLVGLAGRDETGRRLLATLKKRRIDVASVVRPPEYRTPTKTRILAGGIHSAKQQVVRIDRAAANAVDDAMRAAFRSRVLRAVRGCDALLVSDYGSGLATPAPRRRGAEDLPPWGHAPRTTYACLAPPAVISVAAFRRRTDPHRLAHDLLRYHGMTACTPNESEVEHALRSRSGTTRVPRARWARVAAPHRSQAVLITRGSRDGAVPGGTPHGAHPHLRFRSDRRCHRAGDTVIATMTWHWGRAPFEDAARLANHAGGLVVMSAAPRRSAPASCAMRSAVAPWAGLRGGPDR